MRTATEETPQAKPLDFILQFFAHPQDTGAIAASSRELADVVSSAAGVETARTVVEFGPGTGVITRSICRKLREDATFFTIEINPRFVKSVRNQFPDVTVFEDSAVNTRRYLEQYGKDSCDCIVSGLPWAGFGDKLQDSLLETVADVLEPGGRFATYMYLHSPLLPAGNRFRRRLRESLAEVGQAKVVWKNIPPAIVLWGRK